MRRGYRWLALGVLACLVAGCGQVNTQAVQTQAAGRLQLPTVTLPPAATNTSQATIATAASPTVTPLPTVTLPPPTPTALVSTATPVPLTLTTTPTDTSLYTTAHAQYFTQKSRGGAGQPLLLDVTGDGIPEYLYATYNLGCGSCRLNWVTVFSGPTVIFDDDDYFEPVVEALAGGNGFIITEKKVLVGESNSNPSGRIAWTFQWAVGKFAFVGQRDYSVAASAPTAVPPPAVGSIQNYPTAVADSPVTQSFKRQLSTPLLEVIAALKEVERVCPSGNALTCSAAYKRAGQQFTLASRALLALPKPELCTELYSRVSSLLHQANDARSNPSPLNPGSSISIDRKAAATQAELARLVVELAVEIIGSNPGECR